MGMSAWGLLAAPLLAHSPAPATAIQPAATITEQSASADLFAGDSALNDDAMSAASGGSDTAIDIGEMGVNVANSTGVVKDVSADGSTTGQIANNVAQNNSGITTIFNNTGNGVIFQSQVNVNIFTDAGTGGQ